VTSYLVVWGLIEVVLVVFLIFAGWAGLKFFRGAAVVTPRGGETADQAEARATRNALRALVPLVIVTALVFYAFVVWTTVR
jgi:uncharacterized membrane protein SpoIIM required for sporulation